MKATSRVVLLVTSFMPILSFSNCPPAGSMSISPDGKVTPPAGYSVVEDYIKNITSSNKPRISAFGATLISDKQDESINSMGPFTNVPVTKVRCTYGIGEMKFLGNFEHGFFTIQKLVTFTTNLGADWSHVLDSYGCNSYEAECAFK